MTIGAAVTVARASRHVVALRTLPVIAMIIAATTGACRAGSFNESTTASVPTTAATALTSVDYRSLRLIVTTSDDLTRHAIEAEFAFGMQDRDADLLFVFPGVETPGELLDVELDGQPVPTTQLSSGVHPRFGSPVFVLRVGDALSTGELHTLRVRGPEVPSPERGFTRWGSWHPTLMGYDHRVPIDLEVRTPSAYTVMASGRHVGEAVRDGRRISRWVTAYPQGWVFLSVDRYRTVAAAAEGPAVDVVWPEGLESFSPASVRDEPRRILEFYSRTFGDYDPAQFRIVVFTDQDAHNFSVDGVIGISTGSYAKAGEDGLYLRAVLAHELAHYWWGDMVYPHGSGRRWLTEGFAEYARYLYETEVGGDPLPWSYRNLLVLSRHAGDAAPGALGGEPDDASDEVYYQKGAFVLRMLADEIGEDALHRAMRALITRARTMVVGIADFHDAAEQESGRDLDWFFDQWLRRPTGPMLALEDLAVSVSDSGYSVRGRLVQAAPAYRLDVPIEITLAGGARLQRVVPMRDLRADFHFDTREAPERIRVDPSHRIFKWYESARVPVSFADVWRIGEQGRPLAITFGQNVPAGDRALLMAFLRTRFPELEAEGIPRDTVFVGDPAADLRRRRAPDLEAPPPGTVQAFVVRSSHDPAGVSIGIEGDWPEVWPEIIPQASLSVVRYQRGAIVSAIAPALPRIGADLQPPVLHRF